MEPATLTYVEKARSGDPDAFRELVEHHSPALFRLAFRVTGNQQDAEDVVQETFLRAYKQLRRFDERASVGTWLYRIGINCSLDLVSSRKRHPDYPAPASVGADGQAEDAMPALAAAGPTPERAAFSGEVRERVAAAMNELSATERAAFVLRHFEGKGIEEVARILDCRCGAAKHSVFRAVQKLRRALEPVVGIAR